MKHKKNSILSEQFRRKTVERGKIDTTNTQLYHRSLFLLGTGTSIKAAGLN
jgi:hypothetical protein